MIYCIQYFTCLKLSSFFEQIRDIAILLLQQLSYLPCYTGILLKLLKSTLKTSEKRLEIYLKIIEETLATCRRGFSDYHLSRQATKRLPSCCYSLESNPAHRGRCPALTRSIVRDYLDTILPFSTTRVRTPPTPSPFLSMVVAPQMPL